MKEIIRSIAMHHLSESEPVIIVKTEKKKEKENTTLITHYELTQ